MQTVFAINNVSFGAQIQGEDGAGFVQTQVILTVTFEVFNIGPAHVAGLIVTTDFWATSQVAPAVFQGFGSGFENWKVTFEVSGSSANFEFVLFCDDFGGVNAVPRIWNTNGGNRFRAAV